MSIDEFIRNEVQNQGFDLGTDVGKLRVEWMKQAWEYAAETASVSRPCRGCVEELGTLVERVKNQEGFRKAINVRVGNRIAPDYRDVPYLMGLLEQWEPEDEDDCLEWYRCFLIIHPFEDGNGRVGKILYNWWLNKLDDPKMPPDLFGDGVP